MEYATAPNDIEPVPPDGSSGRRVLIAIAVVAAVVAAVAGYVVGRSAADAPGAGERGFDRGRAAGLREYAPGSPRYDAINQRGYKAGRAAGLRAGVRQGEREGPEQGRRATLDSGDAQGFELTGDPGAIEAGANSALGGFSAWQTGPFYLVRMEDGADGVPYRIQARRLLVADQRYALCAESPTDLCTEPVPGR
jgi:hypothetical protein